MLHGILALAALWLTAIVKVHPPLPTLSYDDVVRLLEGARWTFASSPQYRHIPHWYTRQKDWDAQEFHAVRIYIRKHGRREKFFNSTFTYLYVGDWKYFPIGPWPVINRAWAGDPDLAPVKPLPRVERQPRVKPSHQQASLI
jgi:hypothetical protein